MGQAPHCGRIGRGGRPGGGRGRGDRLGRGGEGARFGTDPDQHGPYPRVGRQRTLRSIVQSDAGASDRDRHAQVRPRQADSFQEQRELEHHGQQPGGNQSRHRGEHPQAVRPEGGLLQSRGRRAFDRHGARARPRVPHARVLFEPLPRIPEEIRTGPGQPRYVERSGQARANVDGTPQHVSRQHAGLLRGGARRRVHQHPVRAVRRGHERRPAPPGGPTPDFQLLAKRVQSGRTDVVPRLQHAHGRPGVPARHRGDRSGRQVHRTHLRIV